MHVAGSGWSIASDGIGLGWVVRPPVPVAAIRKGKKFGGSGEMGLSGPLITVPRYVSNFRQNLQILGCVVGFAFLG